MTPTVKLTNGDRIPVTAGEAERVKDALARDDLTGIIKIKSVSNVVWTARPQDIQSVT